MSTENTSNVEEVTRPEAEETENKETEKEAPALETSESEEEEEYSDGENTNEVEQLKGKLAKIRKTADTAQKAARQANIELLKYKSAFAAGLSEEDLVLITATDEEGIAKQVERLKARFGKANTASAVFNLQGKNEPSKQMSSLEQKISEQLNKFKNGQ